MFKITDIRESDLPLIVHSATDWSLFAGLIKWRTKGLYNHVMIMHRIGYFASQESSGYREVPVGKYLKKQNRMKFWKPAFTPGQRMNMIESVNKKLSLPWWRRRYDWIGIVGQAVGIGNFNNPNVTYCSEDVAQHINYAVRFTENFAEVPEHESPEGLNDHFKTRPDDFVVFGRWFYD